MSFVLLVDLTSQRVNTVDGFPATNHDHANPIAAPPVVIPSFLTREADSTTNRARVCRFMISLVCNRPSCSLFPEVDDKAMKEYMGLVSSSTAGAAKCRMPAR